MHTTCTRFFSFPRQYTRILFFISTLLLVAGLAHAATGVIDPNNNGSYQALIENTDLGADTTINFGKFTTQSAYNITVSDSELRGFAWGEGVGWIVTNCADTTSGCSVTNGNFKITNDGAGNLSGYAWGENTGWINFGPFSNTAISTVQIDGGEFGGTLGSAGYAWAQNYGWIKFDCSSPTSCVETDWEEDSGGGGGGGGTTYCTDPAAINYGGIAPCRYLPPPTCATDPSLCPPEESCETNPALCPPPPPTCETNPSLCVPPPDACTLHPETCTPPPCTDPNGCTPPPIDTCATNPDLCTPPPSYCQLHPEECFPPKVPTPLETGVGKTGGAIREFSETAVATIIGAASVVAAGAAALATIFIANPFSLYDLFLILARLWSLLLVAFGLKKRSQPWGVVYDSITKQPIDPAYVVLLDAQGNEVATSITDIEGRYGFSVPAGTYTIIANKTNYEFPSKKLAGKVGDELYGDLYFGGQIIVATEGGIIAKNIPLDRTNFDWNQYAKEEQGRLRSFKRTDVTLARISNIAFVIGLAITALTVIYARSTFNTILLGVYLLMFIGKIVGFRLKSKGSVADNVTGSPLPFSIVRVISTATDREVLHKVADARGHYYILLPNGEYKVVIDRKNADESYTPHHVGAAVSVTKGFLKKEFKV